MLLLIVTVVILAFALAYLTYGRFVAKRFGINDTITTPACRINDGYDYVPAKPAFLLGQHFSAIAAAGPIVGPILAAMWFGWAPALLWIVLGAIFIGGVHDYGSLIASVRHNGRSIAEVIRERMSRSSYVLFLIFMWLTLVYLITAFTDITAQTFRCVSDSEAFGPAVAASSFIYILLGCLMGLCLKFLKMKLWLATIIFLPLVFLALIAGPMMPPQVVSALMQVTAREWGFIILAYCFIASVLPMWLLLQPRGYLGGWFLYSTIIASLLGVVFGGFDISFPAVQLEGIKSSINDKALFPILFITIACGACSGFHGIVASGTTSKQLARESHAKPVGYGAMLLEGLVALLAMSTVMILAKDSPSLALDPNIVFAHGIAKYLSIVGIDTNIALSFALLAFSTFVYDSLDVSTRLARYLVQEIVGKRSRAWAFIATVITLAVPAAIILVAKEKAYLVAWPIFGTTNQLMAGLTLLSITIWMWGKGRSTGFVIVPMLFMAAVSLASLVSMLSSFSKAVFLSPDRTPISGDTVISGACSIVFGILFIWLAIEAIKVIRART